MKKVKGLNKYDEVKLAEIRYGLEGFYLTVTKLIVILFISFCLDTIDITILFYLLSAPIKMFSFGFHANTSFQCLIISILAFIFIPMLATFFTVNIFVNCVIYFILAIGYFIMAPKDTHKKPIRNNKKRFWLKILSVLVIIIYFIISLILNNNLITNLILLALIVQLIMISPLPFLIFKQKYNFKWV